MSQLNTINDLEIHREAMDLGGIIWKLVHFWDNFSTNTIGNQLARGIDSIAAKLSESYGRYHYSRLTTLKKRPNSCIKSIGPKS